uniref:Uncharacterized protein TCIL3000_8_1930 n=1 Tax=Trypanosoma congolense (strain IL3000) TaxID=1068625 RepID=G0URG2_TRYCI|nr:unnamed protein product [Trypanosoma congolense IL3000]
MPFRTPTGPDCRAIDIDIESVRTAALLLAYGPPSKHRSHRVQTHFHRHALSPVATRQSTRVPAFPYLATIPTKQQRSDAPGGVQPHSFTHTWCRNFTNLRTHLIMWDLFSFESSTVGPPGVDALKSTHAANLITSALRSFSKSSTTLCHFPTVPSCLWV